MTKISTALLAVSAGLVAALVAVPAAATPVYSTGYDMPNGDGQSIGGTYNYWDLKYSGSGCTTCGGAALTGGAGDLTDGIVAGDVWYNVENGTGSGPYVGWYDLATHNPVITFHFAGSPTITDIGIHVDTSYYSVYPPLTVKIDGIAAAFAPPPAGTTAWINFTGLNLTGASHTVELDQFGGLWVFASEVTFANNAGAVPEPASWALMIAGFGMVGGTLRSRRRTSAAA